MLQSVVSLINPIKERLRKLSKRESILLYILLIFLIIVGGIFLLLEPAFETHDKVFEQLGALRQEKAEKDSVISQKASAKQQVKEYTVKVKKLKKEFPTAMETEDIDTLVTGLVVKSGMRPKNMEITAGTAAAINDATDQSGQTQETTNQTIEQRVDVLEQSQQPPDTTGDSTEENPLLALGLSSTMKVNTVKFSCEGSLTQFVNLVGLAHSQKGMAIRSFTLTKQEQSETQSLLADAITSATNGKKAKTYAYEGQLVVEVYQSGK